MAKEQLDPVVQKYIDENPDKVNQYMCWLNYQVGFSGVGTTALDKKPPFEMPTDIPEKIKTKLIEMAKEWAKYKWECWCEAANKTVGGNECGTPEEWVCPKIG